jgi:hypothetical protein
LTELLDERWAVFLWGPPGAGKSSVVRDVADANGLPLLDLRAALLDPTDIRGIPMVEHGRAIWCPPSFLPRPEDPPGVLFLDELSAAPPLVQASLYQLVLDRRVGEYVLPDGWRIVAAGNRATDRSIVYRMPAALANRFVHLDFEVDPEDWQAWAVGRGIHPLVRSFLRLRPELLLELSNTDRGFPTPRSWEMASDALRRLDGPAGVRDILAGIVGEGAAIEFLHFAASADSEKIVQALMDDPESAPLPTALSDLYALVAYVVAGAKDKQRRRVAGTLLGRLAPELGVLLARDMLRAHPAFAADAGYRAFVSRHQHLLG